MEDEILYGKIYCANCENCKIVRIPAGNGQYHLRIRCAAGRWRTKTGEEKFHKYFTLVRRSMNECDSYVSMGEVRGYLRQLKEMLPSRDEIYQYD